MFKRSAALLLAAAVFATMAVSAADAKLYRYASYVPPKHNLNLQAQKAIDLLSTASGGQMEWKLFPAGQLFGPRAVIDGVGKRVADASFLILNYYASQLPRAYTMVEMSTLGGRSETNNMVGAEAMLFECPQCAEDYLKQNVIWMSGLVATPQVFMCNPKIDKIADLKGRKVRTSGAGGPVAKALGATPVGLTSAELYTGLERGQIDCVLGSAAWLRSHRLIEKVNSVLYYPVISLRGLCAFCMNKDAWNELSDDLKKKTFAHAVKASAYISLGGYINVEKAAKKAAIEKGVNWVDVSDEMTPFMKKYNEKVIPKIIKKAERRGFKDIKGFLDWHESRQAHYAKLEISDDITVEAYEKMLWDNVYNKVDPLKHWAN